jgi:hypothetical protein
MSNIDENDCIHECKKRLHQCLEEAGGNPEKSAKCHEFYKHCKENCNS